MSCILEFKEIRFQWSPKSPPLFPSLNLQIPEGKATALLGPNGAGKTTIMDMALGWRVPQNGEILLRNKNLSHWNSRKRGQIMALVPQDESVHFDYTVMEYILLGRAPYLPALGFPGTKDERIASDALDETGIGNLAYRKVSRLSGGERQLVLLARALTQQPDFLLLDEPASHLDLSNREMILHILRKLKNRGISLFFTSHNPEMVLRLADHVILLKDGSVLNAGNSEKILTARNLSDLYNIQVQIGDVGGQKVLVWGKNSGEQD